MSDGLHVPDSDVWQQVMALMADLVERAQRLPRGAERDAALKQIRGFQERLHALLTGGKVSSSL
jgi:hypothetical protein